MVPGSRGSDAAITLTMRREDVGSVKTGQTVCVHDPNPPTYGLFEGEVTGIPYPDVLRMYLPDRGMNVSPDLARLPLIRPDEAERARCHWRTGARA
jgi:hypothetical protein